MSEKVHTSIPSDTPLAKSLDRNLVMLKGITGGSSDVIIKTGTLCGARIAVITCEGMADTDTLAQLIYKKLNDAGNSEKLPPEEIMSRLFDDWLIAAEQLDVLNIGDLVLKMQSGFAIVLVDGTSRGIAIGIQGYPSRGVDEPSGELNVRGSREGFVEVIRRNMALIRRRIKSPTLVFEMMVIGERSNTDICLCYLSDKASPKLLEDVKKRLKAVKLNTILESGYLQPFFEGSGGWFFSECGTCERPDSFAAKLYEGRIGILVDGTPFALTVPYLFIENFQTLDDYTQKPFYALFIRILHYAVPSGSLRCDSLLQPGTAAVVAAAEPRSLGAGGAILAYGGMSAYPLYVRDPPRGRDTPSAPDRPRYRCCRRYSYRRYHGQRRAGRRSDGAGGGAERTLQLRCAGALRAHRDPEVHLYPCRRHFRAFRTAARGGRNYNQDVFAEHLRRAIYGADIPV